MAFSFITEKVDIYEQYKTIMDCIDSINFLSFNTEDKTEKKFWTERLNFLKVSLVALESSVTAKED